MNLGAGQDETPVRVQAIVTCFNDQIGTANLDAYVYGAFIDGTYVPKGAGKKASAITGC